MYTHTRSYNVGFLLNRKKATLSSHGIFTDCGLLVVLWRWDIIVLLCICSRVYIRTWGGRTASDALYIKCITHCVCNRKTRFKKKNFIIIYYLLMRVESHTLNDNIRNNEASHAKIIMLLVGRHESDHADHRVFSLFWLAQEFRSSRGRDLPQPSHTHTQSVREREPWFSIPAMWQDPLADARTISSSSTVRFERFFLNNKNWFKKKFLFVYFYFFNEI